MPTTTGSATSARPGLPRDTHASPRTTGGHPRPSGSPMVPPAAGDSLVAMPRRSSLPRAPRLRSRLLSRAVTRWPPTRQDRFHRRAVALPRVHRGHSRELRVRPVPSRQQTCSPRPAGASGRLRVQRPRFCPVGIASVRDGSMTRLRLAEGPPSRRAGGSLAPTRLAGLRSRMRPRRRGPPARASRARPGMRRSSTSPAGMSRVGPTPGSAARRHASRPGIAPPRDVRRSTRRVLRADSRRRSRASVPATATRSTPHCRRHLPLARHRSAVAGRACGPAGGTSRRSLRPAALPLTPPPTRTSASIRGWPERWPKPMTVASSPGGSRPAGSRPGAKNVKRRPGTRPAGRTTRRRSPVWLPQQRRLSLLLRPVRPRQLVQQRRPGQQVRLRRRSRLESPRPRPPTPSLAPLSPPRVSLAAAPLPRPSRRLRRAPRQPRSLAHVPQPALAAGGRDRRAVAPAGGSRVVRSGWSQASALSPSWPSRESPPATC